MFLKIKSNTSSQIGLVFVLGIILFCFNIITEISSSFLVSDFLNIKSLLAILIFLLFQNYSQKLTGSINLVLIFLSILFVSNILLNLINVYELNQYEFIAQFCLTNKIYCVFISDLFFKLKIFRFITLSSYFFSIPILLLLMFKFCSNKIQIFKLSFSAKIFYLLMAVLIFSHVNRGFYRVYLSSIQSFQILDENYYDRFIFKKGGVVYYGWIRVFSNFIISQTSSDTKFLLPPQSDTYKMEGNIDYFRWFMYPRKLFHLENLAKKPDIKIDYMILSAGECSSNDCVWPNYFISKDKIEKIILISRETQVLSEITGMDYFPENFYNKWGLIKLKHEKK